MRHKNWIHTKWITELNVRGETIRLKRKCMTWVGKAFLNSTSKAQTTKEENRSIRIHQN